MKEAGTMTHATRRSDPNGHGVHDDEPGTPRRSITETQARAAATQIGLDLDTAEFDVDTFRRGMEVELEHGRRDPETNVTDDDPEITGKIAWAHLKELPDYYERLDAIEREVEGDTFLGP
jgi:hypothetical protein